MNFREQILPDKNIYKRIYRSNRMYPAARHLQDKVDEYFYLCEVTEKPPTLAAMAISLGFPSVRAMMEYSKHGEDYGLVLEAAKTRIEADLSEKLVTQKHVAGPLASLRHNHEWVDRKTTQHTMEVGNTLASLLDSLTGKTFKPGMQIPKDEGIIIEYADFTEEDDI